jgi:hypothetical protein
MGAENRLANDTRASKAVGEKSYFAEDLRLKPEDADEIHAHLDRTSAGIGD